MWLVDDIYEPMPYWIRKVRYKSWRSVYELTTAKYWVDNIRNAHLVLKKEGQIYLQLWHGSLGFKKVEKEVESMLSEKYISDAKYDGAIIDGIVSCCKKQSEQFKKSFWLSNKVEIIEAGGPRTDVLFDAQYSVKRRAVVRKELGIDDDEYCILYAPTFRERGKSNPYEIDYDSLLEAFSKNTSKTCRIIISQHPNWKAANILPRTDAYVLPVKCIDFNDYIFLSDAVITDFSNILFDAYLAGKICLRYVVDYEQYTLERALADTKTVMPIKLCKTIDELICEIETREEKRFDSQMKVYRDYIGDFDNGQSSFRVVNWLIEKEKQ